MQYFSAEKAKFNFILLENDLKVSHFNHFNKTTWHNFSRVWKYGYFFLFLPVPVYSIYYLKQANKWFQVNFQFIERAIYPVCITEGNWTPVIFICFSFYEYDFSQLIVTSSNNLTSQFAIQCYWVYFFFFRSGFSVFFFIILLNWCGMMCLCAGESFSLTIQHFIHFNWYGYLSAYFNLCFDAWASSSFISKSNESCTARTAFHSLDFNNNSFVAMTWIIRIELDHFYFENSSDAMYLMYYLTHLILSYSIKPSPHHQCFSNFHLK